MRPIRVFDDSSESSCSSDSESEQRVSSQTKILAMTSPASKLNLSPLGSVRKTARKRLDSVSSTGSQQSVLRRSARLRSREPSPIAESPLPPSQLTFPSILEEIPEVPVVVERKSKEKKKGKAANADVHLKKRQEELEKLLDQMKPKSILNLTKLGENKKTKQAKKPVEEADDLFLIDTFGGENEEGKKDITIPSNKLEKREKSPIRLCSEIDTGVENKDLYIDFDPFKGEVSKDPKNRIVAIKSEEIDELMKKSQIVDGFEQSSTVLTDKLKSRRQLKREKQAEKGKTKGHGWFDMPATELTEERRRDLEVLQLRDSLDPKRHYKSNDREGLPKYFQVGTVLDNAADFYHSRMTKKERKRTIVEELLADAEFRRKQKRKYSEIQSEMQRSHKGAFRHKVKKRKV